MNDVIIGQRRQGKTTLSLAVAASRSKTVVVFDPNYNLRSPFAVTALTPSDLERLLSVESPMVVRIGPFALDEIHQAFDNYAAVLLQYRDFSLIVDEAHMLQTKMSLNASLDKFLRWSPADVHVIQTSHRWLELNTLSRYLVDELRMFRNEQPRETGLIEEQTGIPQAVLKDLGDREYVHWKRNPAGRAQWYIQRDSRSWFIDLRNANFRPA
jgi:hypothetical protein